MNLSGCHCSWSTAVVCRVNAKCPQPHCSSRTLIRITKGGDGGGGGWGVQRQSMTKYHMEITIAFVWSIVLKPASDLYADFNEWWFCLIAHLSFLLSSFQNWPSLRPLVLILYPDYKERLALRYCNDPLIAKLHYMWIYIVRRNCLQSTLQFCKCLMIAIMKYHYDIITLLIRKNIQEITCGFCTCGVHV